MEDKLEKLIIGTREFSSRLLVGTGKYKDFQETQDAIVASGAQVVTVAIRRTNIGPVSYTHLTLPTIYSV